ncbi:PDDEXK-like family protein [Microvirga pudoricolor]|uniref:PDDEXK-like family protein n=1 Tax=Microvirga pudoricolor TaxID=2778729 RepID=UPI001E44EA18|nr:PD-(D/E)XK nuclease family protein [Microvirga pudoricolor]
MAPTSFADGLATFFESLEATLYSSSSSQPVLISVDHNSLEQFLGVLQGPLNTAKINGAFLDVWRIAGVGQEELRNSAILAWLLDRSETHGQGDLFLKSLLNVISDRLPLGFPQPSDLDMGYNTFLETYPLGNSESRIDIDISGPNFILFVEVKINASERPEQVARYRRLAEEASNGRSFGVLFLCRSLAGLELSEHDRVVALTWRDVSACISSYLRDNPATDGNRVLREILRQLAQHFSKFN